MEYKKEIENLLVLIKKKLPITQAEIAERLGYGETYVSEVINRGGNKKFYARLLSEFKDVLEKSNIEENDFKKHEVIKNIPTEKTPLKGEEKHTPPVKEITSVSLESLIQINLNQSEALKINARARLIDAENNKILIEAINKENAFNLGSALQSDRLTTAILGFVAQVAAGKRFDNEGLALAAIRKLLQESRQPQGVVDIQTH